MAGSAEGDGQARVCRAAFNLWGPLPVSTSGITSDAIPIMPPYLDGPLGLSSPCAAESSEEEEQWPTGCCEDDDDVGDEGGDAPPPAPDPPQQVWRHYICLCDIWYMSRFIIYHIQGRSLYVMEEKKSVEKDVNNVIFSTFSRENCTFHLSSPQSASTRSWLHL